ncbi:unnamed protein product [Penicillium nalgiovense]|nr:unnamed protein product [Penicillium nalgiovense]CAG8936502.1 unnamed protein product [Penicillium nalgiovense]
MFVGMVRWPRVGPWRWRIVLRPVPPLSSASTSDHRKATFLLGRRIYFLGELLHGLSRLSTRTLVCVCYIDSIEISIESCHAGSELSQHVRFFPR